MIKEREVNFIYLSGGFSIYPWDHFQSLILFSLSLFCGEKESGQLMAVVPGGLMSKKQSPEG